jgi:hypothetical protein
MTRTNLSSILLSLVFLSVAGCGGSQSSAPAAHLATFDKDVAGYWAPKNASNDAYEFFLSPSDVPLTIPLKTGRILREGKVVDMFMWDYQSDGSIRLNKVGAECPARPLSNCPVTGSAQIVANGQTIQGAAWTFAFLDKNSTTPKLVTDTYTRADVNLSQLPQGEFFLKRSDILATPILGKIEDFDPLYRIWQARVSVGTAWQRRRAQRDLLQRPGGRHRRHRFVRGARPGHGGAAGQAVV